MIIGNLGVPRSATILVLSMLRAILTLRNIPFAAENVHGDSIDAAINRYYAGEYEGKHLIIHAHMVTPTLLQEIAKPENAVFFNVRDPRDVVVSLQKLHDFSLDVAIDQVQGYFAVLRSLQGIQNVRILPYDQIIGYRKKCIIYIAERLGLSLTEEEVDNVYNDTTQEKHAQIMSQVNKNEIDVISRQNSRRVLKESKEFFITDRHIQSGKQGRFREELTPEQQQQVEEALQPYRTLFVNG